ncbi:MAG: RDD family protein [Sulfurimonas sp.]|nr:RDD family protein [Sulfurimonas sp.]
MRFRKLKKQVNNLKHTKEELKHRVHYARFVDRIKALITDMFMIYAPILYVITYVILGGKEDFQSSQIAPLVGVVLYGLIYAFLLSKFGQTPGKKAYEMKVVDVKSGENISFFRALYRFVAFLISATIVVGLFVSFYRKDNRALHDLLAGTVVINLK